MENNFDQELISAYLDGELTADEQRHVESLLDDNDDARKLFDELSALRGALQSIPRKALDINLADQVLHRAEREILLHRQEGSDPSAHDKQPEGSPSRSNGQQDKTPQTDSLPTPASRQDGRWSLRTIGWPMLATAAALMIWAVTDHNQTERDPVALQSHTHAEDTVARKESAGEGSSTDLKEALPLSDRLASEKRASASASPAADSSADAGLASGSGAGRSIPAGKSLDSKQRIRSPEATEEAAPSIVADTPSESGKPAAARYSQLARRQKSGQLATGLNPSDRETYFAKEGTAAGDSLLLVEVVMTPEAYQSGAFDRLLSDQTIIFEHPPAGLEKKGNSGDAAHRGLTELQKSDTNRKAETQLAQRANRAASEALRLSRSNPQAAPADERRDKSPPAEEAKKTAQDGAAAMATSDATPEFIYVEASPQQIAHTLDQLAQEHGKYQLRWREQNGRVRKDMLGGTASANSTSTATFSGKTFSENISGNKALPPKNRPGNREEPDLAADQSNRRPGSGDIRFGIAGGSTKKIESAAKSPLRGQADSDDDLRNTPSEVRSRSTADAKQQGRAYRFNIQSRAEVDLSKLAEAEFGPSAEKNRNTAAQNKRLPHGLAPAPAAPSKTKETKSESDNVLSDKKENEKLAKPLKPAGPIADLREQSQPNRLASQHRDEIKDEIKQQRGPSQMSRVLFVIKVRPSAGSKSSAAAQVDTATGSSAHAVSPATTPAEEPAQAPKVQKSQPTNK